MQKKLVLLGTFCILMISNKLTLEAQELKLNIDIAEKLVQLPLACLERQFPYKTGITFSDSSLATAPINYHPIFYGCFDWHSALHGHWLIISLLKKYPNLSSREKILEIFNTNFTEEKFNKELTIFQDSNNKSFERMYGWAWAFQLYSELITWNQSDAKKWAKAMEPLIATFRQNTIKFLDLLIYPIRSGEHTNLAFALRMAYDFAVLTEDEAFKQRIIKAGLQYYKQDKNASFSWEPSGYDFLSPILEEAAFMSRIMTESDYKKWLKQFLPDILKKDFNLPVAQVKDRTDGKLVHLDGLNLSRAWCLIEIKNALSKSIPLQSKNQLQECIDAHLKAGFQSLKSGDYAGEHWLATFATYALLKT
jgi:hypothetical protein